MRYGCVSNHITGFLLIHKLVGVSQSNLNTLILFKKYHLLKHH